MKVLVIGGNRFFGKRLVEKLIARGDSVSVLNRGSKMEELSRLEGLEALVADRSDPIALEKATAGKEWDVIYDQVAYEYSTAKQACEILGNKTKRFIFTSSKSVYDPGESLCEEVFDPHTYQFEQEVKVGDDYAEAKRQTEVGFQRHSPVPVTHVRFPIVIGEDDYSERFRFHVDRIRDGVPIYFPNLNAKMSFVAADFAAEALLKLGESDFSGPINIASEEPIVLKDLMSLIAEHVGRDFALAEKEEGDNHSPYGASADWYGDCKKMIALGLRPEPIEVWVKRLLETGRL